MFEILLTLKCSRRQEALELPRMLLDDSLAFRFDDFLAQVLVLLESFHLITLLLAGHLVGLPTNLQQPFGLPLVGLKLHSPLLLAHLLKPVVLCKFLHHLGTHLLLFYPGLSHLLIFGPLLQEACHLQLLFVFEDLPGLLLLLPPALGLQLFEMKLVAQILQQLLFLAFGLHLADHLVHEPLLLQLPLFLLRSELFLVLPLHPRIRLNRLVLGQLLCQLLLLSLLLLHKEILQQLS
mmetsp:Transcript_60360/g.141063  ORF Transcript_60360/g.141063 Transcript_60360/m.141063 type:complete len:236 (+) Transcript_60360:436-1143(+)